MERKIKSFTLIKSKNIKFEIILFTSFILIILSIGIFANKIYQQFRLEQQKLMDALAYCGTIYSDVVNSDSTSLKEVDECLVLLNNTKEDQIKNIMENEMKEVKKYIIIKGEINSCFIDDILKSDVNAKNIEYFYNQINSLNERYKLSLLPFIQEMETQYSQMNLLINSVNNMYETEEKLNLKKDLTRLEYNQSVEAYNKIKQEDLKNEYLKYIQTADEYLTYKERLEEEKRRQERIQNAWIKLNVPYISQNLNYVFNGCEAASVLMGLKYKGYLQDMDLVTFSSNMPKSNDPNTGFYLDIFGTYPKTEAHWIAPQPLTQYAIASSGNNKIVNATGWDLSSLKNEIINNNPVVIYLTYNFLEPYNWSRGVPKNLHVLLVTGYNSITGQYFITDPYTRSNGNYEFILNKQDIEYLYNTIGKKAIVIR